MLYQWINPLVKSESLWSNHFPKPISLMGFDERGKITWQVLYLVRPIARFTIQPYSILRHVQSSTNQIFTCSSPIVCLEYCARLWDYTLYKTEEINMCLCSAYLEVSNCPCFYKLHMVLASEKEATLNYLNSCFQSSISSPGSLAFPDVLIPRCRVQIPEVRT